jgi:hypothetical protein
MTSIDKSNSNSALFGRFLEGDGFGLVTLLETESQAGLARVKAKPLDRAGWLGRVSQVRVAGLSGLARLSSGKAKTSHRGGFRLIPQPGLG